MDHEQCEHGRGPARWHREDTLSSARAGAWHLRAQRDADGWRTRIRCGRFLLWELHTPVATRADAERVLDDTAEELRAEVETALEALGREPPPAALPHPPADDPSWRDRTRGRWYRCAGTRGSDDPKAVTASEADCGAFRLGVILVHRWHAYILSAGQTIYATPEDEPSATREQGERAAVAGARMCLAKIGAALVALRADEEPPRAPSGAR